jgi:hypothetical protein
MYSCRVADPRRVLIGWDHGAHGIWWVLTKDEREAPTPPGHWSGTPPSRWHDRPRPWSDRLSGELLDDLQAWNDACAADGADVQALQERGRELAIQVQGELGTDGWEVLYQMDGRMLGVHPPGNWPVESWKQELLDYYSRSPADVDGRYLPGQPCCCPGSPRRYLASGRTGDQPSGRVPR